MKNRSLALVFLAAFLILFAFPALAQDLGSTRGNLSGLVYDSSKGLVPGAEVTITGPIGQPGPDHHGARQLFLLRLIPGIYSMRVQKAGFKVAISRAPKCSSTRPPAST